MKLILFLIFISANIVNIIVRDITGLPILFSCSLYVIWLIVCSFSWVLWHINHCWLFNAKSSLYIYIKHIWFGLVGFYGISTTLGYFMPNPIYTYILNIYDLVWLRFWYINGCRLFNAKYFSYIYIKYIWFDLVGINAISTHIGYLMPNHLYTYILIYIIRFGWVYGISTIICYSRPNPLYTYILNKYDLVLLGFIPHQSLFVISC